MGGEGETRDNICYLDYHFETTTVILSSQKSKGILNEAEIRQEIGGGEKRTDPNFPN